MDIHERERLANKITLAIRPEAAGDAEYWRIRSAVSEQLEKHFPLPAPPSPVDPSTLTLVDFGWAPGGYSFKCVDCPPDTDWDANWGAKRAWRCEKHAQQRLDEAKRESAPAAGAPKTTVDG